MSAPPAGSANGSPVPGFYPDPSIPQYIRYWDGTAWVPGTSRPEPREGQPMPEPPGSGAGAVPADSGPVDRAPADAAPADSAPVDSAPVDSVPVVREPPPVEETGPIFFDEEPPSAVVIPADRGPSLPEPRSGTDAGPPEQVFDWDDPRRLHGNRPESATAWRADTAQQSGFGESGGTPAADPRGSWRRTDDDRPEPRTPAPAPEPAPATPDPAPAAAQGESTDTVGIRIPRPADGERAGTDRGSARQPERTVGLRRSELLGNRRGGQSQPPTMPLQGPVHGPVQGPVRSPAADIPPSLPTPAATPATPAPEAARPPWTQQVHDLAQQPQQAQQQAPQAQQQAQPYAPPQQTAPSPQPAGGGLPTQPHSGGPDAVTPWRPPVSDPFLLAAQQQARPAGLGRRLGARLLDGLIVFGVAGAVAFPFVGKATDHIDAKIDAAEQAGVTREIWLVDGTTGGYLALVLGTFLLFGLLYEALPTARWGRTLGKKLFGIRVLDVERQDPPGAGAALLRWLTYSVLALLVVGVVNVLWCLFDRPWRQCWHDKAARTFVAGS